MKLLNLALVMAVLGTVGMGCGGIASERNPPMGHEALRTASPHAGEDAPLRISAPPTPNPNGWVTPPVVRNAGFDTILNGTAPGWTPFAGDPFCLWTNYISATAGGEHGSGVITTSMPQCGVWSEPVAVPPGFGNYHVKVRYIMEDAGLWGAAVISVGAEWLNDSGQVVGQAWGGGFPGEKCYPNPDGTFSCPDEPLGVWDTASLWTVKPEAATRFRMRVTNLEKFGGTLKVDSVKVVWAPPDYPECLTDDGLLGLVRSDVVACMNAQPCETTTTGNSELMTYCHNGCGRMTCDGPAFVNLTNGAVDSINFYVQ